ncbi:MAG: pilus assembly protein TadG-related protein [Rhodoblastus sp.]
MPSDLEVVMFRSRNFGRLLSSVARLRRDERGSFSIIFSIAVIPAIAMIGAAIDYSNSTSVVARAQAAADAAVLAVGAQPDAGRARRQTIASEMVDAHLGDPSGALGLRVVETDVSSGLYEVAVSGHVPMFFGKILSRSAASFSVKARATTNGVTEAKPLELALALDNTGSMSDNMTALKSAANTLVDAVMNASGSNARISVVPYVATVNPGLTDAASIASYIDTKAVNPFNGVWQRNAWISWGRGSCSKPDWGSDSNSSGFGSGGTGDARDILDILKPLRHLARELFGVSSAYAADVTPNTTPPFTTSDWTSPNSGKKYKVPEGFQTIARDDWGYLSTGGCDWFSNPATVSQYELFNRVLTPDGNPVAWKGCVETRLSRNEQTWLNSNWSYSYAASKDYDINDDAPTASDPASLYVPYFAPDEPDYSPYTWDAAAPGAYSSTSQGFHNNYLSDGSIPPNWRWRKLDDSDLWWNAGQFILKYDKTTRSAIIKETPDAQGYTYGPNMGCPDPILRLTSDKARVKAKIDGLNFWQSGGTIISEGLSWAWRTLSPNAPFADAKSYKTKGLQKVIVLMTDGVNELIDNANNSSSQSSANISDYSAYGYLGGTRLWDANNVRTYAGFNKLMNERLNAACTAAKKAGIVIYTVTFNHSGFLSTAQQADANKAMEACASKKDYSYLATNSSSLTEAFTKIAASATGKGVLRLVQ